MPKYQYKALDINGETVRGAVEARTQAAAFDNLQGRRLDVFQIREAPKPSALLSRNGQAKTKDMARYIRQLATLLNAGVSLLDALKSLSRSNAHPALARASNAIRKDLRSGERLSNAMEKHLPALPRYVPRLAELGEATGQSAKALTDAAERMEFEDAMRAEVRTALSYPMFLAVVGTAIVFLLFLFVVPRFGALIGNNADNLPAISKLVIGAGMGLKENLLPVMAVFGTAAALLISMFRSQKTRSMVRTTIERLPMIGPVFIRAELGGWARTVGIALDNGGDLLSALRLGQYGLRSPALRRQFTESSVGIRAGRNIDEVLAENVPEFDPLAIDMIRTGRTSGKLASMLLFIGKSQEQEAQEMAKRLAALAEPIAILLISAIVGTIVISIVLAMTSLYDFGL